MKKYSADVHSFIAENIKGKTPREIVMLVNSKFSTNFTESKMKSYKANHGLKSETPVGLPAGMPTELYPDEVRKFIETNFHGVGHGDMAKLLNKTFGTNFTQTQMKAYYSRFRLNSGLTRHFPKGHVPVNKGKKGEGGWEPTQFKKGNVPPNRLPIGSERIDSKDGYIYVKVQDGHLNKNWKQKHVIVWEKHNGQVPKGHVVIFGDGNILNFDINNLISVSRGQLAALNQKGLIQKDADLTRTAIVITDIFHKISERKKA